MKSLAPRRKTYAGSTTLPVIFFCETVVNQPLVCVDYQWAQAERTLVFYILINCQHKQTASIYPATTFGYRARLFCLIIYQQTQPFTSQKIWFSLYYLSSAGILCRYLPPALLISLFLQISPANICRPQLGSFKDLYASLTNSGLAWACHGSR